MGGDQSRTPGTRSLETEAAPLPFEQWLKLFADPETLSAYLAARRVDSDKIGDVQAAADLLKGLVDWDRFERQIAAHNREHADAAQVVEEQRRREESRLAQHCEQLADQRAAGWEITKATARTAFERAQANGRKRSGFRTFHAALADLKRRQVALPRLLKKQTAVMGGANLKRAVDAAKTVARRFGAEPQGDEEAFVAVAKRQPGLAWEVDTHMELARARETIKAVRARVEALVIGGSPTERARARIWQRQLLRAAHPRKRGRPARGTDRELFVDVFRFAAIAGGVQRDLRSGIGSERARVTAARRRYALDAIAHEAELRWPELLGLFGLTEEYSWNRRKLETAEEIALLLACSKYRRRRARVLRILREYNFGSPRFPRRAPIPTL